MNIWIVGASAGIGREMALQYLQAGHNVAISARDENALNEMRKHKNCLILPLDVVDEKAIKKSFEILLRKFQKIDLFIYGSAIYKPMKALQMDFEFAKKTIDVNLTSVFYFLDLVAKKMHEQKSGHIALIASVAGYRGLPNSLAYGASKAAMINLAESLYAELKPCGIDVSVINPGFVKTRLTAQNNFKMPFLLDTKSAASIIIKGLKAKKFEIHFPKKFTFFLKFLRILPNCLFLKIAMRLDG
jgi:short-subunit dehydrogenase